MATASFQAWRRDFGGSAVSRDSGDLVVAITAVRAIGATVVAVTFGGRDFGGRDNHRRAATAANRDGGRDFGDRGKRY